MSQIFYIAIYVACGDDRNIDQQSGQGLYLGYPVILCINFAFYKRSICAEISLQLEGKVRRVDSAIQDVTNNL